MDIKTTEHEITVTYSVEEREVRRQKLLNELKKLERALGLVVD